MNLGHKDAAGVLYPAFFGVGDNEYPRYLQKVFQHDDDLLLDGVQFLFVDANKVLHVFFVLGVKKGGGQQGVIVVKYDNILMCPWFLNWRKPNSMIH